MKNLMRRILVFLILTVMLIVGCQSAEDRLVGYWIEASSPDDSGLSFDLFTPYSLKLTADGQITLQSLVMSEEGTWYLEEDQICVEPEAETGNEAVECTAYVLEDESLTFQESDLFMFGGHYVRVDPEQLKPGNDPDIAGRWEAVGGIAEFDFLPNGRYDFGVAFRLAFDNLEGMASGYWGVSDNEFCILPDMAIEEVVLDDDESIPYWAGICGDYTLEDNYLMLDFFGEELQLRKMD